MHTFLPFLVLILVSLPYAPHPNPLLVEARRLNTNGFFTVDLIHRDSPHSPYYNSSRHKKPTLGSISSNHHIHLSSAYYDSKVVETDVIPNGGDYLMKIAIGTPPVEFTAVADTGSDLVWVQCSPCQKCISPESPLFDPSKSSTYQAIPCESQSCNYPDLKSECTQDENDKGSCAYDTIYGDGTQSIGVLGQDTITLTSTDAASAQFPSSTFGCGYNQEGGFGVQGNGIVGLGNGPLSLASQLGQNVDNKFSYCLTPLSSGSNSKLKFGVDVAGPNAVSTPFITQDSPVFYYLSLDGINIGSTSVPVGQNIIIDSGTTLTYLETSVYEGVRDALKSAIGLSPVADPEGTLDPCYEAGSSLNPPDVVFKFQGADVVLKEENLFRTDGSVTCLTIVPTEDTFIFGNIAQVNFEIGYDLQAKTVSFAPTDCTKY